MNVLAKEGLHFLIGDENGDHYGILSSGEDFRDRFSQMICDHHCADSVTFDDDILDLGQYDSAFQGFVSVTLGDDGPIKFEIYGEQTALY